MAMTQALSLPVGIVLIASLIAAVTDVWKFKVHNLLTLPLLVSGLVYHGVAGGTAGLAGSAMGVLFGFGSLVLFYAMGGMGAGDVKLMAGVGAWLGMPLTFFVFLASSLAAGVYAVILTVACGRLRETWVNFKILWHRLVAAGRHLGAEDRIEAEVGRDDRRRRLIPFAAMVAVGLVALLAWSWLGAAP
jgi:prepilin peptidase CpaA